MKSFKDLYAESNKKEGKDIILDGADFISQKGYTLIPNYVLLTQKISAHAKIVYAMILSYCWGNKNSAFPGQEILAKDCGISLRSVTSAIKELEVNGFVTITRRGQGKTNLYTLHFKRRGIK
ncbi:MAG: helix-turn-helix domain-containing protein [Snowella sp.]|nr:helix-turn-helix domain-containing protein [Snowella sp.]